MDSETGSVLHLNARDDGAAIEAVASVLAAGGVAVFPTDTVYGIAQSVMANPLGPTRLFRIKRRPAEKTVPWLIADQGDVATFAMEIPAYADELAGRFWPGPLTLVLSASDAVPPAYRAADGTVALRIPDAPFVRGLIRRLGSPLATTSANTSGLPAPTRFSDLETRIAGEADIVVDGGATLDAAASTVVLCRRSGPELARAGALPWGTILETVSVT